MKRLISFRMLKKNCVNDAFLGFCILLEGKCTPKNCPIWKKLALSAG